MKPTMTAHRRVLHVARGSYEMALNRVAIRRASTQVFDLR